MTQTDTIVVQKYGGSSVGSADRIKSIAARIIERAKTTPRIVVVVSAMGDTTDHLVSLAKELTQNNPEPREYDALISTGENVSAALLSMALISQGQAAISLSGGQAGIKTENRHVRARIKSVDPMRIVEELKKGKVVIVTGFQGLTDTSDIATIGRGGSDTSAVVLAAALGCEECEIYTDVDGIYTTDPRIEKKAQKINSISYDEMLDLASLGAKVLHPRAVECAKENNIVLHVRSSFEMAEGTRVEEISEMEVNQPVRGIALKKDEARVSITKVPDQPGVAAKVFSALSEQAINVDMIIQSADEGETNDITFTVGKEDCTLAQKVLRELLPEIQAADVHVDDQIAKVSIVGVGMISRPGIAAKMFEVLGSHDINIELISTSEIKVSCAIQQSQGEKAVQVLHEAFELD